MLASNLRLYLRRFATPNTKRSNSAIRRCFSQDSKAKAGETAGGTRGPVTFLSLAVCAVAGGAFLTYYNIEKEKRMEQVVSEVVSTGKPALGGPFVLFDENGVPRTDASYRGKYLMLYFGFTYCPDICPSELVRVLSDKHYLLTSYLITFCWLCSINCKG